MKYLVVALLVSACAAPNQSGAPSVVPAPAGAPAPNVQNQAPVMGPSNTVVPVVPLAGARSPNPGLAPQNALPNATQNANAPPGPPERHGAPLPELSVKSFGLHIGGSAEDAASRAEFLRVLEASSSRYLDCYRLVEQPGSVGTFGADLRVGAAGGRPKVGKPRTKLRGEEFSECMLRVFENVSFPPTPSGRAAVVSYSVKFNLN